VHSLIVVVVVVEAFQTVYAVLNFVFACNYEQLYLNA
jgi:hypothetical protein